MGNGKDSWTQAFSFVSSFNMTVYWCLPSTPFMGPLSIEFRPFIDLISGAMFRIEFLASPTGGGFPIPHNLFPLITSDHSISMHLLHHIVHLYNHRVEYVVTVVRLGTLTFCPQWTMVGF